jgi:hypothetical protein
MTVPTPAPLLSAAELERIADALAERLRRRPERQSYSIAAAAAILGVDRVRTLPALIAAGSVRTVQIAGHARISREEIERVLREGASLEAPARARRRRPGLARTKAEVLAEIDSIRVEDL